MLRVVVSAPLGNALHAVRREEELTGKLWAFTPLAGEHAGETFPVAVPHYGSAQPFAAMAHDLALIRDLGANSVRPRTMNNKGVFEEYRRLKLCAEVVKKIFRET